MYTGGGNFFLPHVLWYSGYSSFLADFVDIFLCPLLRNDEATDQSHDQTQVHTDQLGKTEAGTEEIGEIVTFDSHDPHNFVKFAYFHYLLTLSEPLSPLKERVKTSR